MVCYQCKIENKLDLYSKNKEECSNGWVQIYCSHDEDHKKCLCPKCSSDISNLISAMHIND